MTTAQLEKLAVNLKGLTRAVRHLKSRIPVVTQGEQFATYLPAASMRNARILAKVNRDKTPEVILDILRRSPSAGKIVRPKKEPLSWMRTGNNPASERAFGLSVLLHEGAEAGRHPGRFGLNSHMSVRPPLQDLNIAATLKGRKASVAARHIRDARTADLNVLNRIPNIRDLNLGNERVSRHALRRIQEAYDRHPELHTGTFGIELRDAGKVKQSDVFQEGPLAGGVPHDGVDPTIQPSNAPKYSPASQRPVSLVRPRKVLRYPAYPNQPALEQGRSPDPQSGALHQPW